VAFGRSLSGFAHQPRLLKKAPTTGAAVGSHPGTN
jgi:hypothetical protein